MSAAREHATTDDRIVFWGWVLVWGSLLLSLLGIGALILGVMATSRDRVESGIAIIVTALMFATVNILILTSL